MCCLPITLTYFTKYWVCCRKLSFQFLIKWFIRSTVLTRNEFQVKKKHVFGYFRRDHSSENFVKGKIFSVHVCSYPNIQLCSIKHPQETPSETVSKNLCSVERKVHVRLPIYLNEKILTFHTLYKDKFQHAPR